MSKQEEGSTGSAGAGDDASAGPVPGLAVFDLDDTLWWPEMYMLAGAPFTKDKRTGEVSDRRGEVVNLHKGVREILLDIHESPRFTGTKIAYASRTNYPEWAYECMKLIDLKPGVTMHDVMSFSEVYPGDKDAHLRRMSADSGVALEDMVFFDNEMRNCRTVSRLGVTCVYTPDGMSTALWKEGLKKFAEAKARAGSAGASTGKGKGKGKSKGKSKGRR